MELTKDIILDAIKPVDDPDLGMSLVDMGLIYEVAIDDDNNVKIKMTLSSPSCPIAPQLMTDVEMSVREIKGVNKIDIDLVWEPEWDPETMATEEVKDALGIW
jgi:metal-sulfur cluster biosynthetic enzyme